MKSIQYYGPQNIKYEEVMVKPPQEGEIVVIIMSALTCGTDVKTYRRGHPVLIKNIPSGFGHEFAGRDDCARHYYGNFKSFMRNLTSVIMEGMLATAMFGGNGKIEKVVTL